MKGFKSKSKLVDSPAVLFRIQPLGEETRGIVIYFSSPFED